MRSDPEHDEPCRDEGAGKALVGLAVQGQGAGLAAADVEEGLHHLIVFVFTQPTTYAACDHTHITDPIPPLALDRFAKE